MQTTMRRLILISILILVSTATSALAQKFVHPGINQTSADLQYMKKQVLKGVQPWKDAFERLKAATPLNFVVKPYAHVIRGPYGDPNIGGDDLSKGANLAYNCALMWYITDNKDYANKAIEIINAWSPVLWDFDYNDAKLLAGWTGHLFCNAAEILRYTNSGWQQKDIDAFTNMLTTVYYPLMRYYFPQANGNWDGAIIHSIMAIAIFTDNREMFNNALNHFLYSPVNGSIFKYIYPSGQCQESIRDQGHVQLGLGEFAGAARVAYTQGIDLFSIGNNRIALGYEYTAKFILNEKPQVYGVISELKKEIRDDYEYVYRHYTSKGIAMPFSKIAADSIRPHTTQSVLTAFRAPEKSIQENLIDLKVSKIGYPAGAFVKATAEAPSGSIIVKVGESLQKALDKAAGTERWVIAAAGIHTLPTTLKVPSGVTLAGEGLSTIIFLDPASGKRDAIINATTDLHDVTIRDLIIEGSVNTEQVQNHQRSFNNVGRRGGIVFLADKDGQMKNINLINLTVQNCVYNGIFISGASQINIVSCDLSENGANMVPGPRLLHNLLLTHCEEINVKDCRLDTSPQGSGIALDHSKNVQIINCEIARNGYYGVLVAESKNISLKGNLIEGNDRSGIMLEFLSKGSEDITIQSNLIHFNNGEGVESYSAKNIKLLNNTFEGNRNSEQKISDSQTILME